VKWLNNDANGPWLLVLDNSDDIETFFGSSRHTSSEQDCLAPTALVSYLPQRSKGAMIITTRDRRIGDRLAIKEKPIVVMPFEMKDARHLLQKTIREDELNDRESMALLEALEFLPLAITQAAAYIRANGVSLEDYLESLRASDEEVKDLLDENLYDPGRDLEIRNSVFQTLKISFDRIRKQNPRAADMLSLMAVLDRQAIQDKLIRRDGDSKKDFTIAIGTLKAFSLIIEEKGGAAFKMHRLVQLSTQRWLELEGVIKEWQAKALTAVSKCCSPNAGYENWTAWEAIDPHVQVALGFVVNTDSCLLQRARLLSRAAGYNLAQGRYEAAYRKAVEGFAIREKLLEDDHVDKLASISIIALVLQKQGKYEAAEEMNRRALNRREKVLGPKHLDTLTSVSSLAWVLERLGKYKAAERMNRRTLNGREKLLGPEFPLTLTSVSNLASVLERLGKYKAAEKMNRRALDGYEKALGPEHPDTLTTVNNLASILGRQGKYEAAEEMNGRAVDGSEKALGPDHPETLTSVSNLALVL
jgi:tetratricopeptide (TPR) repeat protein